MRWDDPARDVLKVYGDLDDDVARFKATTGLRCADQCGACCERSSVEATSAELLPLAVHAWHTSEAVRLLERIAHSGKGQRCVLYAPDALLPGAGRCGAYSLRPLLCRLFGFSARVDRHGGAQLVTCRRIKESCDAATAVERADVLGVAPPIMRYYSMRMYGIAPTLGEPRPINDALRVALEAVAVQREMSSQEQR